MTDIDVLQFFERMPQALPLYEAFAERLQAEFETYTTRMQKTQITFSNKYVFACVSLPVRKVKGRPEVYIIVTFGLSYRVDHPRIAISTEPHPNRWTHHVIVSRTEEIDQQLMDWVRKAYEFSMCK